MKTINNHWERNPDRNLALAIEPLANYICAAERPREVLLSAPAALFAEVRETNRTALAHFSSLRTEPLGLAS